MNVAYCARQKRKLNYKFCVQRKVTLRQSLVDTAPSCDCWLNCYAWSDLNLILQGAPARTTKHV